MLRPALLHTAIAGLLLFGSPSLVPAQTISTVPSFVLTTGIVGVTVSQTARLNVLNLQPVIPGVSAVACPATLEFYDDTGALLKQLALTNIAPATAASLVFKPAVASTGRAQIRGVVLTPQTSVVNPGASPPTPFVPLTRGCTLMSSLEIIDDSTGTTHTLTTDLRAMLSFSLLPAPAAR